MLCVKMIVIQILQHNQSEQETLPAHMYLAHAFAVTTFRSNFQNTASVRINFPDKFSGLGWAINHVSVCPENN